MLQATVEGWPQAHIVRFLNCSEGFVAKHVLTTWKVMRWDVLQRQAQIKFGCADGSRAADCETDECEIGHWEYEMELDGEVIAVWYWFVIVGSLQRGRPSKFWIEVLGITSSKYKPRMPKLKQESWRPLLGKMMASSNC